MVWLPRILLSFVCMAAVLYTPAAHTYKLLFGAAPRYNGILVTTEVRQRIPEADMVLFGDDRFVPPFLDLITEKYKAEGRRRLHWIFPTMMGNIASEEAMVRDFVCLIAGKQNQALTWLLNRDRIKSWDRAGQRAVVVVETFRRQLFVEFLVDDVIYEVQDSVFLRGHIGRISAADADGDVTDVLLSPPITPSECIGKQDGSMPALRQS